MTNINLPFPKRMIHLDFHTGPAVTDIGKDFNADEFAQTFVDAKVDSVTLFAMCHHGHIYYDTNHPARHPFLPKNRLLLEEQIEALNRVGIRTPIYITVQCNEYAADNYPEWIALNENLQHVKGGGSAFEPAWQILDMSSPYQEYLVEIVDEVLRKFKPVDGLFLDMCWDQPSCSKWAIDGMRKRGYDPKEKAEREKYANEVVHNYMDRFSNMLYNSQKEPAGIWFNSRSKTGLYDEAKYLRHVEIESLPTGGWGYMYFPYVSRFVRPLGLPTLSHTGRFFKSWGDNSTLKPEMALKYECCQILAQSMTSGVGDLLHPYGKPSPAVYDLIGKVYSYIEKCEPYVEGAAPVSQIALLVDPKLGDAPGPSGLGAVRALTELKMQFDILPYFKDFSQYEMLMVPESTVLNDEAQKRLEEYVKNGGAVMLSGMAAFKDDKPLLKEQGIQEVQPIPSHSFMHAETCVADGIADYGYVMYEEAFRVEPAAGTEVLVKSGEPFFQRAYNHFSGHEYTAEKSITEYASAVKNGRVITLAVPLLEAYGKHAMPVYRNLLGNCIKLLIESMVKADGPSYVSATAVKNEKATIVHFLSFSPERRADGLDVVEDAIPVVDLPVSVRMDKKPGRVYLAPDEENLDFVYENGFVHTKFSFYGGHCMLVLEK